MHERSHVLKIIRQVMEEDSEVDEFLISLGDPELNRMVFHSAVGDEHNLRLSTTGYEMLKKTFEHFEVPFEEDYQMTTRDILFLKENCSCPYYVSTRAKIIGLFEHELGVRVQLVSGNISALF